MNNLLRISIVIFTLLVGIALIPISYAEQRYPASGGITGTFPIFSMRQAGDNVIINFTSSFVLTGTLSGTCSGFERDVIHSNENRTFFGECRFNGSVGEHRGTALLRYEGHGSLAIFGGTTVVHGGTGGLTGLSLVASWEGQVTGPNSAVGTYSGQYHL